MHDIMSLQTQKDVRKRGDQLKTAAEGKTITKEIVELLLKATEETKNDLLIILQWENMKQNKKNINNDCEVIK